MHRGIDFISIVEEDDNEIAKEKSKNAVEQIINFLSFTMLSPCEPAVFLSSLEVIWEKKRVCPFKQAIYIFEEGYFELSGTVNIKKYDFDLVWNSFEKYCIELEIPFSPILL